MKLDRDTRRAEPKPFVSVLILVVLILQSACLTGAPGRGLWVTNHEEILEGNPNAGRAVVHDLDLIEPDLVATRPVPIDKTGFRNALERLTHGLRLKGTPQDVAREMMGASREPQEAESVAMSGVWEAEAYNGQVYSLTPVTQTGPGVLTPEADEALRSKYLGWCEQRGGGDCLGLLDDGPYLRARDRRTLALALAFGSVLNETRDALGRELNPRALTASLMWAAGLYLALWLVPEPATKRVAAVLTVLLVAWLGADTLWGLVDGWALMAKQAHEASTFEELRSAGEKFAQVMGTDAARALIMAVTMLIGHTVGQAATWVRSLPSYRLALVQFETQGLPGLILVEVQRVEAVVASSDRALAVMTAPEGAVAGAMLTHNGSEDERPRPGGSSATEVYRHRGGSRQVTLGNGQRWHLPRGVPISDIPASDPVGDELQTAAERIAKQWGPDKLSDSELAAIDRMTNSGKPYRAFHLERQARGRWIENRLREQFEVLEWNRVGVDVKGPGGQAYHYEIMSGTESNFELHGRRMSNIFFRMIYF